MSNRLLDYSAYSQSNKSPPCPDTAALSVLGRGVIVTRNPEHIILTSINNTAVFDVYVL